MEEASLDAQAQSVYAQMSLQLLVGSMLCFLLSSAAIRIPVPPDVAKGIAYLGAALLVGWIIGAIVNLIAGGGAIVGSVFGTYFGAIAGGIAFVWLARSGMLAFLGRDPIPAFIAFFVICGLGGAILGRRIGF